MEKLIFSDFYFFGFMHCLRSTLLYEEYAFYFTDSGEGGEAVVEFVVDVGGDVEEGMIQK